MTTPVKEKRFESDEATKIPRPFVMRRFHSLLGLWLTIYLTEHLLVNSQAAFFFQDENSGFVKAVNRIHEIPYLKVAYPSPNSPKPPLTTPALYFISFRLLP